MINHILPLIYTDKQTRAIASDWRDNVDRTPMLKICGYAARFSEFVENVCKQEIARTNASVQYVTGQPYDTAEDMRLSFNDTGLLLISTDFNDSPLMGDRVNLLFRTAHDLHHIRGENCNFGFSGEVCAYTKFAHYTNGLSYSDLNIFRDILFSEIIGQVAYVRHYGEFPEQKTPLLSRQYRYIIEDQYEVQI